MKAWDKEQLPAKQIKRSVSDMGGKPRTAMIRRAAYLI